MNTSTTDTASVLNGLIETCRDGQEGFQHAAENVKTTQLSSLFTELASQRQHFIGELQTLVRVMGEEAENAGSASGAIHRGWIDLKSAVTGGSEHAILAECERGEDSAVAEYKEAADAENLPANVRGVIRQQYAAVQAAHDRVRDLRDSFQA